MENPLHQAAFSKLQALPVPMAFGEVFTALQQGTIDAGENSLENIYTQNFNEVAKHVTLSGHGFGFVALCLSEKSWGKIPEEYHAALMEAGRLSAEYEMGIMREANEEAKDKMKNFGVTIYEIDRAPLMEACASIPQEFKNMLPQEYMREIDRLKTLK
jgi:TRAP-type C4-dicarboxylate transport system substrate-binding protein